MKRHNLWGLLAPILFVSNAFAWEHVDICYDEVKRHWDNGNRTVSFRFDKSVQRHGYGENLIFSVNDKGNIIRDINLKRRKIRCYYEPGMTVPLLNEYPNENQN